MFTFNLDKTEKTLLNYGVYKITCKSNNKSYIGSTSNSFKERLSTHIRSLKNKTHYNPHLQNSFNKYGMDAFTIELLSINPKDVVVEEQKYLDLGISEFNILPTAYSTFGFKNSQEQVKNKVVGHRNKSLLPSNTSGYKGVRWCKHFKKWHVQITLNAKNKFIGYFKDKEDAVKARKDAETLYYI